MNVVFPKGPVVGCDQAGLSLASERGLKVGVSPWSDRSSPEDFIDQCACAITKHDSLVGTTQQ
jgi:hypothetical protein